MREEKNVRHIFKINTGNASVALKMYKTRNTRRGLKSVSTRSSPSISMILSSTIGADV